MSFYGSILNEDAQAVPFSYIYLFYLFIYGVTYGGEVQGVVACLLLLPWQVEWQGLQTPGGLQATSSVHSVLLIKI